MKPLQIPMSEYLAMPHLGSSTAFKTISQSPMHAKYYQDTPSDPSKQSDLGTVIHRILLEGDDSGIIYIDAADWRTNAAKEARDNAYAKGLIPLLEKQRKGIQQLLESARQTILATEIGSAFSVQNGQAESTFTWNDNGVDCKIRPDYLTENFHISLKTVDGIGSVESWIRWQLSSCGYDFQLAFYDRGLKANGINVEHRILVLDQKAPYGGFVVALDPSKRALADAKVDRAIRLWGECLISGIYTGYSNQTYYAEATAFELEAEAEIMAEGLR